MLVVFLPIQISNNPLMAASDTDRIRSISSLFVAPSVALRRYKLSWFTKPLDPTSTVMRSTTNPFCSISLQLIPYTSPLFLIGHPWSSLSLYLSLSYSCRKGHADVYIDTHQNLLSWRLDPSLTVVCGRNCWTPEVLISWNETGEPSVSEMTIFHTLWKLMIAY